MNKPLSDLAAIQAPTIEVRQNGELLTRVSRIAAAELVERGWATPRGKRVAKYLELLATAPWRPLSGAWRGNGHTTRLMRGNGDVVIGRGNWQLEHKPLPSENPDRAG
jgi:hypothetical protein